MKKYFVPFLIATILIISCKKEATSEPEKTIPVVKETAIATEKNDCYRYSINKDTIALTLQLNGTNASGVLIYDFYEKDKNLGTYKGTLENNILIADYTFKSEGKESTRQVAFKITEDNIIEGYGELNAEGTKFIDLSKIAFNSKMMLTKVPCD